MVNKTVNLYFLVRIEELLVLIECKAIGHSGNIITDQTHLADPSYFTKVMGGQDLRLFLLLILF